MLKFRELTKDEIECRIGMVSRDGKGLSLLLYKDARCDMRILDETVGAENWQNRFYEHKGILFCSVGINTNFDKPEAPDRWVWKDDAGVESNTEAEKGNASDARKRAGVAWSIGRSLYTAPFIWIKAEDCNMKQEKGRNGDEWKCKDTFAVEKIIIKDGEIAALAIWNKTKNCRAFVWQKEAKKNA